MSHHAPTTLPPRPNYGLITTSDYKKTDKKTDDKTRPSTPPPPRPHHAPTMHSPRSHNNNTGKKVLEMLCSSCRSSPPCFGYDLQKQKLADV